MTDPAIPADPQPGVADPQAGAGTGGGTPEGEGQSKLAPTGAVDPAKGYWPAWHSKYRNDFRSAKEAKANDGLVAPRIEPPAWVDDAHAGTPTILEAARRRHDQAAERGTKAEERSARLVQTGLTLLTLAFLIAGFEANRLRDSNAHPLAYAVSLGIDALAILMLGLAIIQAQSVDRVGYAQPASPDGAAARGTEEEQRRALAVQEVMAAEMANWTGRHKVNEFLQARAWFTRAVTALAISGLTACIVWQATDPPKPAPPTIQVNLPTTTAAPTPPPTTSVQSSTTRAPTGTTNP
jgi:hypothetical protein